MQRIKLEIKINLLTPLHIGGEPGEDTNTKYILRGADGRAYYPGTAFKGKTRHYARMLQKDVCKLSEECDCSVCRLFGGVGNARSSLFFSDFHANGENATDIRAGNKIDRYRRVAEDEKLFTTESAAIREMVGAITGKVEDNEELNLLKDSIRLIQQIGGNTSRGFGWVDGEIAINEVEIEQQDEEPADSETGTASSVSIVITPTSPLLIGTHTTQSNFRDTQFVIPGAVLRAALARAICELDGTNDPSTDGIKGVLPEDRETSFTNLRKSFSELRFSVLNPKRVKTKNPDTFIEQTEPYPITTRKCKYDKGHEKVDILAMLLSQSWKNGEIREVCPKCSGRLEKVGPYEDIIERMFTITSTHSEMDRWRGTSQDKRLYTVRAISQETAVFQGTISGDIDMKELSILLKSPLHIGAMTTTGFGECEATFEQVAETQANDMIDRINRFNEKVGDADTLVPITLMSDAIVNLEEPKDQGDYKDSYKSIVDGLDIECVITKPRIWRGFETSKKQCKEKEPQYLLQAGSVIVIRVGELTDSVIDKLMRFEREGIGEETKDGYGAVRVAHENHTTLAIEGEPI